MTENNTPSPQAPSPQTPSPQAASETVEAAANDAPVSQPSPDAKTETWVEKKENGEIVELQKKCDALQDQLLRTAAELQNTLQRHKKQLQDSSEYAVSNFAKDMVAIVDDFTRAIQAVSAEQTKEHPMLDALYQGVVMIEKSFLHGLERHGVKSVMPGKGDPFDHHLHQAVANPETTEVAAGTILDVMQKGYKIHDRLLRPAMVSVAKAP
jgi:molecular chaperone GrpE